MGAAKFCIAEVEEIVEIGEIPPDHVHIPSIYVHKVFQTDKFEKRIERLTLTKPGGPASDKPDSPAAKMRENIVRRAALEFKDGMYANLGNRYAHDGLKLHPRWNDCSFTI